MLGIALQNHPVKFSDPCSFFTKEPSENHDTENSQLSWLMQSTRSPECPRWCCCGQCNLTQKSHEQLCCRSTDGPCITTTYWFKKLVLSRETLNKALLYEDPFLDVKGDNTRNQLRHAAYKQYVHWRFGSFELEDRAVIPSCCRRVIRSTYPSADGNYTGFKTEWGSSTTWAHAVAYLGHLTFDFFHRIVVFFFFFDMCKRRRKRKFVTSQNLCCAAELLYIVIREGLLPTVCLRGTSTLN